MSHPKYSVVIPTRQRHETLPYAMASVLTQTVEDFELIVVDNFSSPQTAQAVNSFDDPRIVYVRADRPLAMSNNWELGLSHTRGEYVTFLGDDDALLPDCIEIADKLLSNLKTKIVAWTRECVYWWPGTFVPWQRDKLYLPLQNSAVVFNSHDELAECYRAIKYYGMPMLYNSFIHRDIIEKVKSVHGKYFVLPNPDVYSGYVNAYFSETFIYSNRPMCVAGNSAKSTGTSACYPSLSESPVNKFVQEAKDDKVIDGLVHPSLIPVIDSIMCTAATMLHARDMFYPSEDQFQVDIRALLFRLANALNWDDGAYDRRLEELRQLADKYHIPLTSIKIPAKKTDQPKPVQGMISVNNLAVNCRQAGVTDVAAAAKLAWGILPQANEMSIIKKPAQQKQLSPEPEACMV